MKQHVRDDEFANIILLSDPPVVLNVENLKAIRDGDALIATGKPSRSNAKIARHPIGVYFALYSSTSRSDSTYAVPRSLRHWRSQRP